MLRGWKARAATPEAAMLAAIAILVIAAGRRVFSLRFPCSHDDAFITFRYARNLADGWGPVFNHGERIWGYTSPLQVLVLALLARMGADIPTASIVIGLAAAGLSAWLAFRLASELLGARGGLVVGMGLLASGVSFSWLSVETPWVGALLWAFMVLACRERPAAAGLVGALACLARPDSLVLVLPALLATPALRRPRSLLAFALPGVGWVLFCRRYYGHVLPNSFYAKAALLHGAPQATWREQLTAAIDHAKQMLGAFHDAIVPARGPSSTFAHLAFAAIAVASCAVVLASRPSRTSPRLRPLLLGLTFYPWAMIAAYAVIRPPVGHVWEYWNAIGLLVAAMLTALASLLVRRERRSRARDVLLGAALVAALVLGSIRTMRAIAAQDTDTWGGDRHGHYAAIAAWLKENARPDARVAWNEPGTLAYLSGLSVYDAFLVSGPPPAAPEYVFGDGKAVELRRYGVRYRLVRAFPYQRFGPMDLYGRVDR